MLLSSSTLTPQEVSFPDHRVVYYGGCSTPYRDNSVLRLPLGMHDPRFLNYRSDLKCLSIGGFSWGSYSSGAEQLSLALLCDVYDNDARALRLYPHLCNVLVQHIPPTSHWILSDSDIRSSVRSIETIFGWNWIEKYQCYSDEIPV